MNTQQVHITSINSGMNSTINTSIISDTLSDGTSDDDPDFDDSDLLNAAAIGDDVTAQLVSAGPIGIAAAAAIATARKRKRPHSFETNPSIRKRQQTRLLRKLRATIEEYTTRVGQQAVVLCCTPGKTQHVNSYRVFGSMPLENIVRGRRPEIMGDLDAALAHQAPHRQPDNPALHELPALNIDGIPTPVDKMTQAQLRAFIPEMLKYSTGRSKPGWGKPECRPMWWPDDVPWANVRSDVRSEEQKKKVSWTHALRTIVKNCYRHHNRDDLLPDFQDDHHVNQVQAVSVHSVHFPHQPIVQTINNPDGTVSVIHIDTGDNNSPQVITLADGTQAQVVHTLPNGLHSIQDQAVHTLAEVATNQEGLITDGTVEISNQGHHGMTALAEATINSEGHLVLSGDHSALTGDHKPDIGLVQGDNKVGQIIGMVTIPVTMYQSVVTSLGQLTNCHATHLGGQTIGGVTTSNVGTLQVIAPGTMSGEDDEEVMEEEDSEDIKPLIGHTVTEHMEVHDGMVITHNGNVPDATQAVEVMSAGDVSS